MFRWLAKSCMELIEVIILLFMLCIYGAAFILNAIILPLFVVIYFVQRGRNASLPRLARWKCLFYPSWKEKPQICTDNMTGYEYEQYCARVLREKGYRDVVVTPPVGDYGADIVATDPTGERCVIQCKRYRSSLGNSPIQEVVAAKRHYGATKAGVMTNSQFTQKARELAFDNDVMLWELID